MDRERYSRQKNLYGWDEGVQDRLGRSTVFIAGLGGLGGPASIYLAAAGIGHLRICDPDTVQASNLNRQILYAEEDIGKPKAGCAAERLERLNSVISILPIPGRLNAGNVSSLVGNADLILDCLDNYEGRMVINQYAVQNRIPLIHAGVTGMNGQISFLDPPQTPCLKCIYPESPEDKPGPILGAAPGIIGTMQALEAIKYLSGTGQSLKNKMILLDGESLTFHEIHIEKNPGCKVCGGYS
jgi:adenylyltransferase/sulfurtransferase